MDTSITSHTLLSFPSLTTSDAEDHQPLHFPPEALENSCGAFRGLAFAVVFQTAIGIGVLLAWEFWRIIQ